MKFQPRLIAVLFSVVLLPASGDAQQPHGQITNDEDKERSVEKMWRKDGPLQVKSIKTKKGESLLGKKLVDEDDWFNGLSVVLENTTDKTITYIGGGFLFPRRDGETGKAAPLYKSLSYGHHPGAPGKATLNTQPLSLAPGGQVTVTLSGAHYNEITTHLQRLEYPQSIKTIKFNLEEVYFSDGTGWVAGTWVNRHEDRNGSFTEQQSSSAPRPKPISLLGSYFIQSAMFSGSFFLPKIALREICTVQTEPPRGEIGTCGVNDGFYSRRCCIPEIPAFRTDCYKREAWIRAGTPGETLNTGVAEVNDVCKDQFGFGEDCMLAPRRIHIACGTTACANGGGYWNYSYQTCGTTYPATAQSCYEHQMYWDSYGNTCNTSPPPCPNQLYECSNFWEFWDEWSCMCRGTPPSPILIDVSGDGFDLTDAATGVTFDISNNGRPLRISWTSAGSDDAWLTFDRDNNGTIDGGHELFGNVTPQPAPPAGEERQGFLALAEYDKSAGGGNGDGKISNPDAIFSSLRLWRDANHDGVSQPAELKTLAGLSLTSIDLDYKRSKKVDAHGNEFRYRAKVRDTNGAQLGRWAWDVFLLAAQ